MKLKLFKVLEHVIKNDKEKAEALWHTIFIEKARAIHEELMRMDDNAEHDMDEEVHGSGDQGRDLTKDIDSMNDEIDFEETMGEDDDTDIDDDENSVDDSDVSDDNDENSFGNNSDVGDDDVAGRSPIAKLGKTVDALDDILADLKAEFERLDAEETGEPSDSVDGDMDTDTDMDSSDSKFSSDGLNDTTDDEEDTDESWNLDEEFDDLAESLELEVISKDMLGNKTPSDVGSGKSGMSDGKGVKSPVASSQKGRYGAKPIETGKGATENGYSLKAAPKSLNNLPNFEDNRRKKATDKTVNMSSGNYGAKTVSGSKLETTKSEFNTDSSKMSPLSRGNANLK